jgi:uncharacterized membrane-anchored protein
VANLGKVATFKIPIGWQFLEEQDAQVAVQQLLNEKSRRKGMLGALAPEGAGNYWVIFEYTETGYAPETAKEINAAAILKTFRDRMQSKNAARVKNGESQVTSIDWEMTPSYDPADHTLEWAIRAESRASQSAKGTQGAADKGPIKTVNQTLRFLGRHGVMDAIVVRRDPGFVDRVPLKELVKGFAFRGGERYENYQASDKTFAGSFTDLIASESDAERSADIADGIDTAKASYMGLLWIGLGGLAGLATVGILVATVLRRRGHQEYRPAARATPPEPALGAAAPSQPAPAEETAPGAREVAQAVTAQLALAGMKAKVKAEAAPVVAQQKRPLSPRPAANRRSQVNQRRKMFDYNRYFTDLMSTVSHYATSPDSQTLNGYSIELGKPTGETAPVTNGNGHAPPSPNLHSGSDLISHQAAFIEEQRRLIQEQSRLIEEKSKLIAEKNQLLKLQSELIDNKLL